MDNIDLRNEEHDGPRCAACRSSDLDADCGSGAFPGLQLASMRLPIKALQELPFSLRGPHDLHSVDAYRRRARRALPHKVWEIMESGADQESTLALNRSDFGRWQLRQRVLTGEGPEDKDLSVVIDGATLALPVALSSPGLQGLFHWHGELGAARAAEKCGTRHTTSTGSSYSLAELSSGTAAQHWFQLYPWGDQAFLSEMIAQASDAGFSALFVTVDVPVVGNRERERLVNWYAGSSILTARDLVDGALHPRWARDFVRYRRGSLAEPAVRAIVKDPGYMRPSLLTWETLDWIRDRWSGPLYVKGIMEPDDAVRAMDLGCEGVMVSNHGGRQLDSQRSSVAALPAVAAAIGERGTVLIDGGIRRGTDVIKALCLGADACLIGRPLLYGLAVNGEDGVADVLGILRREIETTLTLMGCSSVRGLDATWIEPADVVAQPARTPGC